MPKRGSSCICTDSMEYHVIKSIQSIQKKWEDAHKNTQNVWNRSKNQTLINDWWVPTATKLTNTSNRWAQVKFRNEAKCRGGREEERMRKGGMHGRWNGKRKWERCGAGWGAEQKAGKEPSVGRRVNRRLRWTFHQVGWAPCCESVGGVLGVARGPSLAPPHWSQGLASPCWVWPGD